MAADTRDPNPSSQTTYPSTTTTTTTSTPTTTTQDHPEPNLKTYERFGTGSGLSSNNYTPSGEEAAVVEAAAAAAARPPQNANLLPGGTMNTAGDGWGRKRDGSIRETSILEAAKTIKLRDFKELHKKPCVRDSFLVGIGAGFGIGGIRAVIGAPVLKSCSWAVGAFVFGSFFMHEYCQRKRMLEIRGLKMAAEMIDQKRAERLEQMRIARQKAREEVKGES